jgi:hypothetical protein
MAILREGDAIRHGDPIAAIKTPFLVNRLLTGSPQDNALRLPAL